MQLARGSSKISHGFTSILRDASFSKGWLHFAVQCFFAIITVVSFILIIIMSKPNGGQHQPVPPRVPRCDTTNCIIYCDGVPYFGRYTEDIAYAVSKLPDTCAGYFLTLHKPMFRNETLPTQWLPRTNIPIHELSIIDGNLNHFPPEVFLHHNIATLRTLVLHGLMIKTLTVNSLVGLSKLLRIYIKRSTIVNIQANVFRAVDDTLEFLTISQSEYWNPVNITGTTKLLQLTTVDFSHNNFNEVLNRNSFSGLVNCKTLYLNSCKISAIGKGTFDNLLHIEMLFLNNNLLVTIPPELFANMMLLIPKPRINMQDNLWRCNCQIPVIKELVAQDMLLIDPVCVSPRKYNGKTFSELKTYCNNNTNDIEKEDPNEIMTQDSIDNINGFIYINNGCYNSNENASNNYMKILAPLQGHGCSSTDIYKETFKIRAIIKEQDEEMLSQNNWITFMFFLKSKKYTMLQIGTIPTNNFGLLWYQSTCPNEVYCVNVVSTDLKVFNVDMEADYVFCPVHLLSGILETERCVFYNAAKFDHVNFRTKLQLLAYISIGGISLVLGAIFVYALVRNNPNLLKGSKRILFVKHKNVDALVLPPKVPLRNGFMQDNKSNLNEKNIFTIPSHAFAPAKFNRNKSTRSSKSNAPSYISALQPTEDQLAEWRVKNHFNNDLTICSADFYPYMDIMDNDKTYDSLN